MQQIIPTTPNDFERLKIIIGIDNDKFCPHCDGQLKTSSKGIFSAGIFYKCLHCGKEYKKTNIIDIKNGSSHFQLSKI